MKNTLETLKRYLQYWDPIGVIPGMIEDGYPPNEYDSYADPLYTVLAQGGSVTDVYTYLESVMNHIGLPVNKEREMAMAISLHTYFNEWSGYKK